MELSQTKPDILVGIQTKKCREAIGMALASYLPGAETHSSSGVPCVIYGEYMWIYLGFTPCASVRAILEEEYNAVFGKIIPVESCASTSAEAPVTSSGKQETPNRDMGFVYGTPFVGIPLPR